MSTPQAAVGVIGGSGFYEFLDDARQALDELEKALKEEKKKK